MCAYRKQKRHIMRDERDRFSDVGGLRSTLPACGLLLVSAIAIGAAGALPSAQARQVAVLFSPFESSESIARAVAATGVRMVRDGAVDTIVVVDLDHSASTADLYRAGAWLVLDAVIAGGCSAGSSGRNAKI